MKIINSFKDVEKRVCKDLAWYICYECVLRTQQQLKMGLEEVNGNKLAESIFMYTLEKNFKEILAEHVFKDPDIIVEDQVLNQAARFFTREKPNISTIELSSYLSYLDNWSQSYPDWTRNHPVPLKNMIIVPSD